MLRASVSGSGASSGVIAVGVGASVGGAGLVERIAVDSTAGDQSGVLEGRRFSSYFGPDFNLRVLLQVLSSTAFPGSRHVDRLDPSSNRLHRRVFTPLAIESWLFDAVQPRAGALRKPVRGVRSRETTRDGAVHDA